ncbi:MAG: site-specific DNA-methyltransferase [Eubacteriales bacterium]
MANISKLKRDRMLAFLEELKKTHSDDESICAFNGIENALREKKYGLVWEEHTEEVDDLLETNIPVLCEDKERRLCKDEDLPWNFIIEGDNLQALYILEKTHKGRVDCIYIDPPYNTGAKDWKYNNDYVDGNDVYRHSKWLSMMKNRLMVAKNLLNPQTGVLIVAIDDNELNTLGLLLQEIFPTYKQFCITVVHNPNGNQGKNFGVANEFAYFMIPSGKQLLAFENRADEPDIRPLRDVSGNNNMRTDAKNCFYPIYIKDNEIVGFGDVCDDFYHPMSANILRQDGIIEVYPIDASGNERKWVFARHTVELIKKELHVEWNNSRKIFDIIRYKTHFTYKTIWDKKDYNANSYGSKLLNKILGEKRFDYPKSLYTVKECIQSVCENRPNAIVVDFFAGSGTTQHAVNLLNKEYGGQRKCIMVTNNEVSVDEAKKMTQQGYKQGDPEWEALGIAKYVTWPRTVCSIEGKDINGEELRGEYITTTDKKIKMSEGFKANVKYFKCDWIPRKPEDYLLSNALCLHIKEMIELQTAQEVDGVKNVLILNRDDFNKHIADADAFSKVQNIWLNQNMILSPEDMSLLSQKSFKYIPREYFGQELREAAE